MAQADSLRRQCQLARRAGKPLVVHVRDAHAECATILEEEGVRAGQIHCFTGDEAAARRYLDLGFHLSISGIVTYQEQEDAGKVLNAAFLTYVASALTALLTLLYYLYRAGLLGGRSRD